MTDISEPDGLTHISRIEGDVAHALCGFTFRHRTLDPRLNEYPLCFECLRAKMGNGGGCRVPDWA